MFWLFLFGVLVAVWIVFGIAHGSMLGLERKGNPSGGVWLAMMTGPFAELFIERVPDKNRRCPYCEGVIPMSAEICPHCNDWLPPRPRVVEIGPDVPFMETRRVEPERHYNEL